MPRPKKFPDELVERGIRLALESERPIAHIAADLGMHPETLRKRVRQHEADSGMRPDLPTTQERIGMHALHEHAGLVVEPSAALGIAAVLEQPGRFAGRRVTTILCGSNVVPADFARWVMEPAVRAAR